MDEEVNKNELWNGYLDNSSHNEIKRIIKDNINNMCANYISIGYCLKKVNDRKLYLDDGYSGLGEYAEREFGLKDSKASKLIKVIEELCVNGDSPVLREEYKEFSIAKLEEIIYLNEQQREEVSPEMTKQEIRKVKTKDKVSPAKVEVKEEQLERVQGEIVLPEETPIDELDLSVRTFNMIHREGIDTVDKLVDKTETELLQIKNLTNKNVEEIKLKLDEHGSSLRKDSSPSLNETPLYCVDGGGKCSSYQFRNNCNNEKSSCSEFTDPDGQTNADSNDTDSVIEPINYVVESSEIVIKTEDAIERTNLPKSAWTAKEHIQYLIKHEENGLKEMRSVWEKGNPDALLKHETMLLAYKCLLTDMKYPNPEPIKITQPDLPKLKNNDQRKEFIDNYSSWPVWIDQKLTGERYHRYDLTDKVAMVVKVNLKHAYENYKETKTLEYGVEQYYLLGIKAEWSVKGSEFKEDSTRTFYECGTNKSALVEYLKEFQKGQVN